MPPQFINSAASLVTTREATCEGFLAQAKVKSIKATPYVEQAVQLWGLLQKVKEPSDLLADSGLREALVSTAGVSAKAMAYLKPDDIQTILKGILDGIPKDRQAAFREEVFYRYLLTRGASLDGEMRNYAGAEAGRVFASRLIVRLGEKHDPVVHFNGIRKPKKLPEAGQMAASHKTQAIIWPNRMLVFDRSPALVKKNVDVILLDNTSVAKQAAALLQLPVHYLACGELKGGIDPAGADEHWKTATAALERIRTAFASQARKPALFFIGAAIQAAMAAEIFAELQSGTLAHAANLTVPQQVDDLISWLVGL